MSEKSELTLREVAERFNVSPQTIYNWIGSGFVEKPPRRRLGRRSVQYFPLEWVHKTERILAELESGHHSRWE